MFDETITYEKTGHVMFINMVWVAKEQKEIARLSGEPTTLCSEIRSDRDIRMVVINFNQEKRFPIPGDLISEVAMAKMELGVKFTCFAKPVAELDKPVIMAINGNAVGQSLELALACDMRIASDTSHFGLPYINAGMIPWDGGTQRLSRLVGRGKAMEMILTGELIDAQEAYRIGLVNKVVPAQELMPVVMNIAQEMASKGPIALRYAKEAIHKGMDLTLEQGLRLEADLYFLLHTTMDRTEGIKAFQEKRDVHFEGK